METRSCKVAAILSHTIPPPPSRFTMLLSHSFLRPSLPVSFPPSPPPSLLPSVHPSIHPSQSTCHRIESNVTQPLERLSGPPCGQGETKLTREDCLIDGWYLDSQLSKQEAMKGIMLELEDSTHSLLVRCMSTADPNEALNGADVVIIIPEQRSVTISLVRSFHPLSLSLSLSLILLSACLPLYFQFLHQTENLMS